MVSATKLHPGKKVNFIKSVKEMISQKPQQALLFMPDISGFTQFVSETEIIHSQHIIRELLEILIDSNHLDLQVCEVEGDAIFFYRPGLRPALPGLLKQVEEMFTRFHAHLKLYEHQRICPCGACKTAVDLSLKIVVHFGEVTGIAVKEHKKLFGRDVILVHRLLKNNLDKREYVLMTDNLIAGSSETGLPSWYMPQQSSEAYDAGAVGFTYSDLSELHRTIKISLPVYTASSKTYIAFTEQDLVRAPMEQVFENLLSMQREIKLYRGPGKNDSAAGDTIVKIGEKHPCLITRNNNVNITESIKVDAENIEMVEMNEKGVAGYRYLLKKLSPTETAMSVQMLIKDNPFFRIAFSLALKSKMMKKVRAFFGNLKTHLAGNPAAALNL